MSRSTFTTILLTAGAAAGLVTWALVGLPGGPAACVAADVCDCEAVRSGAIAQPANAWSSLALVAAGLWVVASGTPSRAPLDRVIGVSIAASGLAAFAAHASATAWGYRLDGAAVVLVVAVLVLSEWVPPVSLRATLALATGAAVAAATFGAPGTNAASIALGAALLAGLWRRRTGRPATQLAVAAVLLVLGAGFRTIGASNGAWCDPGSLLQGHAAWHVLAAGALVVLIGYLRSAPERGPS